MSEKFKAHFALAMVALFYGLNYVIAKDVMVKGFMTPFGFIMLRILAGVMVIFCVHAIFVKEKMERKDIYYAAICAVFGVTVNMLCFFEGLKHTSPIHASLIMILTPILVLLVSAVVIRERITVKKVVGILMGMAGAYLLIAGGDSHSDRLASVYGDLMIMVNALSYGVYLVLVRRLTQKYNPITVLKWVFIFGTLYVLPFGGRDLWLTKWSSFSLDIWLAVGYVLIFATCGAYLLNVFALSRVMPSTVGFYIYFQPLIASIVSISLGKESLDGVKIASAVLLFIAVYIVNHTSEKEKAQKSMH